MRIQKYAFFALFCGISSGIWAQPMQQGDGIWLRDAYWGEAQTFDACNGHQPGNGEYHHHAAPSCLREQLNDNIVRVKTERNGPVFREKAAPWTHSPILGWAFDGYPIYGPYGYTDPRNASSAVRRVRSSFRLRTMTERTSLPDWTMPLHASVTQPLTAAQSGPRVSAAFPLGRYIEDYEYVAGLGELDVYNGRFTVTPEFPDGTYAYFVTIHEDGKPAFPYILGAQFRGNVTGGNANTIPTDVTETVAPGSPALITSWATRNAAQPAQAASGFDPSAGARTTWPFDLPAGARTNGSVTAPTNADIQQVRFNASTVYVNANSLASYTMGPWFDVLQPGGVFGNFPSVQRVQRQFPRQPTEATTKRNTGLGAQGLWVNGVPVFNVLDGASYSNARSTDAGGGLVALAVANVSAASFEAGPVASGSYLSAFPLFGLSFSAPELATVTVRDAAGAERIASISFRSASQINYRLPDDLATGFGTVSIASGGMTLTGNINVRESYANLFQANADGVAAGTALRVRGGQQSSSPLTETIDLGPESDQVYLILYGSGLGKTTVATAAIGGVAADVIYAGPQGEFPGLDQFNVLVPRSLAGRGRVEVVLTAAGKKSNPVRVTIR
jgi:uncharacterized protein (TIGR03437 family)